MLIDEVMNDESIRSTEKTEKISKWLLEKTISIKELIDYARNENDSIKATCIEAIEYATKEEPSIANENVLHFVSQTLNEKTPRVKWESARVIGNIAHLFPAKLDIAVGNLLANSGDSGTVVRWSTAFALSEIMKLNTKINAKLLPAVEAVSVKEEKNSIKKIYVEAIKNAVK